MSAEDNYIIISGTSKAATTSIFNYLSDHPQVTPAKVKQTNYFLDEETQANLKLHSSVKYQSDAANYEDFYISDGPTKFKLEASPDYMYSEEARNRLASFSESRNAKLIFVLRDPVSRFKSWYQFGKQQGSLSQEMSFQEYYEASKNYTGKTNASLLAYESGFYSRYLSKFSEHFGSENLCFYFYEDLKKDPKSFVKDICVSVGLDLSFYDDYDFKHYNKTVKTKNKALYQAYNGLRSFYLKYLYKGKLGVAIGKVVKGILSPLYHQVNTQQLVVEKIDDSIVNLLVEDYREEKNVLQKLIGETPWD